MREFIMLMHNDAPNAETAQDWECYIATLRAQGIFDGGSSFGDGACFRKHGSAEKTTSPIVGYLKLQASDLFAAQTYLKGNPAFEAGGTVEIRELIND